MLKKVVWGNRGSICQWIIPIFIVLPLCIHSGLDYRWLLMLLYWHLNTEHEKHGAIAMHCVRVEWPAKVAPSELDRSFGYCACKLWTHLHLCKPLSLVSPLPQHRRVRFSGRMQWCNGQFACLYSIELLVEFIEFHSNLHRWQSMSLSEEYFKIYFCFNGCKLLVHCKINFRANSANQWCACNLVAFNWIQF